MDMADKLDAIEHDLRALASGQLDRHLIADAADSIRAVATHLRSAPVRFEDMPDPVATQPDPLTTEPFLVTDPQPIRAATALVHVEWMCTCASGHCPRHIRMGTNP
jgi:hypothetical protein